MDSLDISPSRGRQKENAYGVDMNTLKGSLPQDSCLNQEISSPLPFIPTLIPLLVLFLICGDNLFLGSMLQQDLGTH